MISVDFLVHTLPKEKGKTVHQEILKENYADLTDNEIGIYRFLHALEEEFPGTLEACGNDECWVQVVWYNRFCVQLPALAKRSKEVFNFARKQASAQGLCLYRFDEQKSFNPTGIPPKAASKADKERTSLFFAEVDEWNAYAKTTANHPYDLDGKIKIVSKDAEAGIGPAMQILAQLLAFKAKHKDTAEADEKPLFDQALKLANAVKGKAYERGIESTLKSTAEYLGFAASDC